MPSISVASTLYNSERHIAEFVDRIFNQLKQLGVDGELVLVNDGSPDNSLVEALKLKSQYPKLRVISLSKNFGHHKAMRTAISQCKGDYVFAIDSDLEEPPEILADFYSKIQSEKADVVYGVQVYRKGGLIKKNAGGLFYTLFNSLSGTQIPKNLLMARLMTRRYVDGLMQYRESSVFLGAIFADLGFKQVAFEVEKEPRKGTTYSFNKRLQLALRAITSFSYKPLKIIFYTGFSIWVCSTAYLIWVVIGKFLVGTAAGWASLIASIWFLGGLNILFLGVIGIYLSVIFTEIKNRPVVFYEIEESPKTLNEKDLV